MTPGSRPPSAWPFVALAALAACDSSATDPRAPDLAILTQELEPGAVGQLYGAGIDAEGGVGGYLWEVVSGALPPGLALTTEDLTDDDLLLTGVPEQAGTFAFTVRVTTDEGVQADSAHLTLDILPPPNDLEIENVALPPTVVGGSVAVPLRVTGAGNDSPVWAVVRGALPSGLLLEPEGRISGAADAVGRAEVVLGVTNGSESTFKAFTMQVFPNDRSGFGLTLFPLTEIAEELLPHVETAAERWESVITDDLIGGLVPADFFGPGQCGGLGEEVNGTAVDDLLVLIYIDSIDGAGSVLGQAGPCGIRGDLLPFVSMLTLDESDLLPLVGTTTLTSLVTHELGHALGFGSLWPRAMLLEGEGTADPRFTGKDALAEWHRLGGSGDVPVESEGGEGTAESHWRESVFRRELMTGFAEPLGVLQPLSALTLSSLADLGYAVERSAADPFALPGPAAVDGPSAGAALGWDVVVQPVRVLDDFGTAPDPPEP